jgi:hypothetical protein
MSLPYRFMLAAILFVVTGMLLGLYMGPSQDLRLVPVHVHLNLVGWATMMLFGLYYRGDAVSAATRLAGWHFWIAVVGAVVMMGGLAGVYLGNPSFEPPAIIGALLTFLSMAIFGWTVWRASQRKT